MSQQSRFVERFEMYVDKGGEGGCHLWTGSRRITGYGQFSVARSKAKLSHRVAYELYVGPIPPGMFVLHHCDVRTCVNPSHLFIGTHQDNMDDMAAKGTLRGSKNPNAKLDEVKIAGIRRMLDSGVRGREVARKFDVNESVISRIKHGLLWGHTPELSRKVRKDEE